MCALYKSHNVRYAPLVPQLAFQRARTEENKRQRAEALVEAARSLAVETGVASVTLTAVAKRAGIHYSAVRRYFTSHKEVLLHLAAEGWVRWSSTVCDKLAEPGTKSPALVAETLANGLVADPLFCDLLANLHLDMLKQADAMQQSIDTMQRMYNITSQMAAVTHHMDGLTHEMLDVTSTLRDNIANFDDFFRPIRSYFYGRGTASTSPSTGLCGPSSTRSTDWIRSPKSSSI